MNEDKQICIYQLLHEPGFSTVNPFMADISRVSFHELVNLNSFMFKDVFFKLKKKNIYILPKVRWLKIL